MTYGLGPKVPKVVTYHNPPKECNICHDPITTQFVDGATKMGPWANMCLPCNARYGIGLGTGRGQHFVLNSDGKFEKVEG